MKPWILALTLLLGACQLPTPSADYDVGRDYTRYQTWQWQTPAFRYEGAPALSPNSLLEQRLEHAIQDALLQRGLTPGAAADIHVQVGLSEKTYQEQYTTQVGARWDSMAIYQTRNLEYPVLVITLDLFDSRDQRLIWRNRQELMQDEFAHPAKRQQQISQSVQKLLSQYPPR